MTKAGCVALALLALGASTGSAEAQPSAYPPRAAWIVGHGYAGYSGYPWPGPPWAWPVPAPRRGCYDFRQDIGGVVRRVEVCE